MKRWLLGLLCLMLSGVVLADGPDAVRKRVQASMLVTGTVVVATDGSVAQYALDKPEKLPDEVKELLAKSIPAWRFDPVEMDGKPVIAKAAMNLRVVAKPLGNDQYSVSVAGVSFGDYASEAKNHPEETITYKKQVRPNYPIRAATSGVTGTVYVLLKVGRDGKVVDATAEQVNLRVIASDSELAMWRKMLADATLLALKHDTFNPPTVGKEAGRSFWAVRIPVSFAPQEAVYGQWQSYVPGPVQEPAWKDEHKLAGSADAVPEGGMFLANTSLHLRTPIGGT